MAALRPGIIFAATTGLVFAAIVVFAFYAFSDETPSVGAAMASIAYKASLPPPLAPPNTVTSAP